MMNYIVLLMTFMNLILVDILELNCKMKELQKKIKMLFIIHYHIMVRLYHIIFYTFIFENKMAITYS